jgi:hypothetical protein
VVSGAFTSKLDSTIARTHLTAPARAAVASARTKPLVTSVSGVAGPQRVEIQHALTGASVYAFRIGMGVGAALAVLGGVIALVGIQNPRRRVPCEECPGGALAAPPVAAATERARPREREPATTPG